MNISLSEHFSYQKLLRFVFPSVVMMIFTSIYSVVDGLFISNFVGKLPFAAINLVFPFFMIIGGIGFLFGSGGTALVSKKLGEGKKEEANDNFSLLVIFTLVLGIFLGVIGFLFLPQIITALGANEAMWEYCLVYGRILFLFLPIFMLQNLFQNFLVAAEKPQLGLYSTVASGISNMLLDALFIIVFRWGIAGAGLATGIGQLIGGVIPLIYFLFSKDTILRLRWSRFDGKVLLQSFWNGSSELMNSVSSSIVGVLYNWQLMKYIGEDGVSAFGVLMYVQFIFIAILIGYCFGIAPVISYHYGAENHSELKNLLHKSLILMGVGGVILSVLSYLLAPLITAIFVGYDPALYHLTLTAFRIFAIYFLSSGINTFASSFFTSLNNGSISAMISLMRTLVFEAGAVLLLPNLIGNDGIWWASGLAGIVAFILSMACIIIYRRKYQY